MVNISFTSVNLTQRRTKKWLTLKIVNDNININETNIPSTVCLLNAKVELDLNAEKSRAQQVAVT